MSLVGPLVLYTVVELTPSLWEVEDDMKTTLVWKTTNCRWSDFLYPGYAFSLHKCFFTRKPLGHGSWESLHSHWLRVSQNPALSSYEGSFGPQSVTFSVDEKSTWNPAWQVWITLAGTQGGHSIVQLNNHVNTLHVKNPTFYIKHHQNASNFYQFFFMSRYTRYLLHSKKMVTKFDDFFIL